MKTMKTTILNPEKNHLPKVKYVWAILLFFITVKYTAQNLLHCRNTSYYTYIFTIDNKLAKNIYDIDGWETITEKNLVLPIDSFLSDSGYKKQLPVGHYVFVNAFNNNLHYELKSINSIDAYLYADRKRILFFPYNKNDLSPITNATVQLNKHKATFDKKTNAYKLKKTKEGFITVALNNEQAYYSIEKNENWDENRSPFKYKLKGLFRRKYYRSKYNDSNNGYIAFNKPKYLPKDTV